MARVWRIPMTEVFGTNAQKFIAEGRQRFGWVQKAQLFWSARRVGASWFEHAPFQGFCGQELLAPETQNFFYGSFLSLFILHNVQLNRSSCEWRPQLREFAGVNGTCIEACLGYVQICLAKWSQSWCFLVTCRPGAILRKRPLRQDPLWGYFSHLWS